MNHFRFEMDQFWDILSVNKDVNGLEFVSTIEAKNYPIFGTQFHPEKSDKSGLKIIDNFISL